MAHRIAGNGLEAWNFATKEERRDLLRMCLEAVYADMPTGQVVALEPKSGISAALFRLTEPIRSGSRLLVTGDPEGNRGRLAQNRPTTLCA
jgi:hypothetical protein